LRRYIKAVLMARVKAARDADAAEAAAAARPAVEDKDPTKMRVAALVAQLETLGHGGGQSRGKDNLVKRLRGARAAAAAATTAAAPATAAASATAAATTAAAATSAAAAAAQGGAKGGGKGSANAGGKGGGKIRGAIEVEDDTEAEGEEEEEEPAEMTNFALLAELKARGVGGVARWSKERLVTRVQEARDAVPAAAAAAAASSPAAAAGGSDGWTVLATS
jgi:hypothetical protein